MSYTPITVALTTAVAMGRAERTFDPVTIGMNTYADYAQAERKDLVAHYPAPENEYQEALGAYQNKLSKTVGLVSTSTEIQSVPDDIKQAQLIVGLGLAGRAIDRVLRHEALSRINTAEDSFAQQLRSQGKQAKNRIFTSLLKNGPAEQLAKNLDRPHATMTADIASALTGSLLRPIDLLETDESHQPIPLEEASLTVIQNIVPVQTNLERAAYQAAAGN